MDHVLLQIIKDNFPMMETLENMYGLPRARRMSFQWCVDNDYVDNTSGEWSLFKRLWGLAKVEYTNESK